LKLGLWLLTLGSCRKPNAELRIVPDAVHLWNLQQPELFNETVAEFVARSSDHIRGSGADG
jgi:pimeloyl-ACP methyl ester carboxylesterase